MSRLKIDWMPLQVIPSHERLTYEMLGKLISRMDRDQSYSDVTVEINRRSGSECYAASLKCEKNSHDSLDEYHPILVIKGVI